jgi:hypothetical protein
MIGRFRRCFSDAQSRKLIKETHEAQLRFDCDEAPIYLKAFIKHAPQFAAARHVALARAAARP